MLIPSTKKIINKLFFITGIVGILSIIVEIFFSLYGQDPLLFRIINYLFILWVILASFKRWEKSFFLMLFIAPLFLSSGIKGTFFWAPHIISNLNLPEYNDLSFWAFWESLLCTLLGICIILCNIFLIRLKMQ